MHGSTFQYWRHPNDSLSPFWRLDSELGYNKSAKNWKWQNSQSINKLLLSATNWHIIKKSLLMKQLKKKTSRGLSKTAHQEVVCQINHREGKTKGNPKFRLKTEVWVSDVFSSAAGTWSLVDLLSAFTTPLGVMVRHANFVFAFDLWV